ncbi:hypothetical protein OG21DRAFT_1510421 [Imleria badia]|nr:hypothetical protein OG21DRAFT_1510421 [Imleria badia]
MPPHSLLLAIPFHRHHAAGTFGSWLFHPSASLFAPSVFEELDHLAYYLQLGHYQDTLRLDTTARRHRHRD